MNDIREILNHQLGQGDLDLLDIVQIPLRGDPMLRLRTLEEALEDFNQTEGDAVGYLIQVKQKRAKPTAGVAAEAATSTTSNANPRSAQSPSPVDAKDAIYLGDGKLNIPFLSKNAELLFSAGENALARNIYKAILTSGERKGLAHFGIARCDEVEGRFEEARTHYEESIAYHGTLESYQRLASVLMTQKKDQLAAEVLERAINLKEINQRTRFELHKACGNCWTRAKGNESAQKHFQQALEINPAADDIRSNLGALFLQAQRTHEAKRHFQDALASNPRSDKALMGLGSCAIADGDKRQAHDFFVKALEIELRNPAAIFHLVKCAYEIKSYATAARLVEEYVQIAPVNVNLLYSLGGLQFHLGRANDARATARQILSLHAEHVGAKELLNLIDRFTGA